MLTCNLRERSGERERGRERAKEKEGRGEGMREKEGDRLRRERFAGTDWIF